MSSPSKMTLRLALPLLAGLASAFAAPPAPTGLNGSIGVTGTQASLTWNASAGANSYNIKRSTSTTGTFTTIASGVSATSYVATGLTAGTPYYFIVTAVDGSGESGNSATLGVGVSLTPINGSDGQYRTTDLGGKSVWQNISGSGFLYFRRPATMPFTSGQTTYVRVVYYDQGYGRLNLQYDATTEAFRTSPVHTRTSRVNSGQFVTAYFELPNSLLNKRQNNGNDFRLGTAASGGILFSIQNVMIQSVPFEDPDFVAVINKPWQSRYTGPAKSYADTKTQKGKVMAGYQGWFRTPNDLEDGGWFHWTSNNRYLPENYNTDMWPDLSQYPRSAYIRAEDVLTKSGQPAFVFSSTNMDVVRQHFRWMRKHNIDGAYVQRFHPRAGAAPEWVLRNVSEAANKEGLIWAIEYDVSGMSNSNVVQELQADWQWLTTQFGILSDPAYAWEGNKPVVFIWGFPFEDRNFTVEQSNIAVEWFKAQGCYVIGGIPNIWRNMSAEWNDHIARYDGVLVWQGGSYSQDRQTFNGRGQDYYPHTWPGFSWANLKKLPANSNDLNDRQSGETYWDRTRNAINGGADRLFVGMFDEYDEGTAIMPMSDDHPNPPPSWGRFINNQGQPSDWWMMLTDELKRGMLGQRTLGNTRPSLASIANRSNIGPEASIVLQTADTEDKLSRVDAVDGQTTVESAGGKESRTNANPSVNRYMYFNVANDFAHQLANGDITIEVEYFDAAGNSTLGLQYDSSSTEYKAHSQTITTRGSNTWRKVRFEMTDAYFGGRENNGADFRLVFNGTKLNVGRVWVRLPEDNPNAFVWTNTASGDWSGTSNWADAVVPQSNRTTKVEFFTGQSLPSGAITANNNNSASFLLGTLRLGGSVPIGTSATVTIAGTQLNFSDAAPSLILEASSRNLVYNLNTALSLASTLTISGNGDAFYVMAGNIGGSGGLTKTGASNVVLTGTNNYSGVTTISEGGLTISGSITGGVNVASSGRLEGTGSIAGAANIQGANTPRGGSTPLRFGGTVSYGATSKLRWVPEEDSTAPNTYGRVAATGTVTVTNGAAIDLFTGYTASLDFTKSFWAQPRSWQLLSGASITGTFVIGEITNPRSGQAVETFGTFSLQHTANAVNVVWTPHSPSEVWRRLNFGANWNVASISGDNADPDDDGIPNRVERALNGNPNAAEARLTSATSEGNKDAIEFTRKVVNTDLTLIVQGADDLSGPWTELARSQAGAAFVTVEPGVTVAEGDGDTRLIKAEDVSREDSPTKRRFLRVLVE